MKSLYDFVSHLPLSVRTANCIKFYSKEVKVPDANGFTRYVNPVEAFNIQKTADLLKIPDASLLSIKNFGRLSLAELKNAIRNNAKQPYQQINSIFKEMKYHQRKLNDLTKELKDLFLGIERGEQLLLQKNLREDAKGILDE